MTLVTQAPEENVPTPRTRSQSQISASNNAQDSGDVPASVEGEEKKADGTSQEFQEQDEKLKKSYEQFYEVIKAHQGDQIIRLAKKEEITTS